MKQEMVQSRNRLLKCSNFLFWGYLQNGKVLSRIKMTEFISREKKLIFCEFIYQKLLYISLLFKSGLGCKCICGQKWKVSSTGFFLSPLLPPSGQWMTSIITSSISAAEIVPLGILQQSHHMVQVFPYSKERAKRCCKQQYINPNF